MNLRPYQSKAISDIYNFFASVGKHAILQAPTGSGKTIIFSELSRLVSLKNKKILILTDRAELLFQAGGSLKEVGLNSFYIQDGCKAVSYAFNAYVAMSQTLRRRIGKQYWDEFLKSIDLLIIDECHKQEFNYIFESGLFYNKHVIGFTATPKRSGKMRQLALDYETIIETVSVRWLIENGYLVQDDYFGFESPDMHDVAIDRMNGDYQVNQMFQKFNSPKIYAGAVKNYRQICDGSKALVFCVNIEHVIKTTLEFVNNGIDARFIVSDVSKPKYPNDPTPGKIAAYEDRLRVYELLQANKHLTGSRKVIFEGHKSGKFPVLINAGIATTGYDDRSIETLIILRGTVSLTLLLQMLGRGSRICDGKTHFNVLDFGGNCGRLGYYSEDRIWSLWHESSNTEGLPPIKTCGLNSNGKPISEKKGCNRPILASYKICPFCGFKYPDKEVEEIDLSTLMYDFSQNKAIKTKLIKDMSFDELEEYRKLKGHKQAWLWRQLWYKDGEEAIQQFAREKYWNSATTEKAIAFCKNF